VKVCAFALKEKYAVKGVGRKFSRGEGATEKRPKISKKNTEK